MQEYAKFTKHQLSLMICKNCYRYTLTQEFCEDRRMQKEPTETCVGYVRNAFMPASHIIPELYGFYWPLRYAVVDSLAHGIKDLKTGEIVMEVTSADYAYFLCDKLNRCEKLEDLQNRPSPDLEFFEWASALYN